MDAFCSAVITKTNTVASVRNILQAVELLTSATQQQAPGKSPIRHTWNGNVARKARLHTTELPRLKSAHACGSHLGIPPYVQELFDSWIFLNGTVART